MTKLKRGGQYTADPTVLKFLQHIAYLELLL